ncbi:MAG: hypothetical protein KA248_00215 [Kiritimatiellae bacterium]|nr:hypothetical protein [Kiritimatiellia bacterium]
MKFIRCLCLLAVVASLASCSGGKYADAKAAMNDQISFMDDFVSQVEKAGSGKEVAAAVNRYSERMSAMMEKSEKLKEKYKGEDLENAPELKEEMEKVKAAAMKFAQAFMKIGTQYGDDPEVQAAMAKWRENMTKMAQP